MKLTKASGAFGLLVLAAISCPFAAADDAGWYAGANVGESKAKIDDRAIANNLQGAGFTMSSITNDNRDTGYKIFGGYQINQNLALEGGYFDLGKFGFSAATLPPATLNGNIKIRGLNLDLVGILPITEKFSAFGRIGMNYAEAKDSFAGTGLVRVSNPSPSKRDLNYKVGLGLQYDVSESLALRAEAERYRINDVVGHRDDIDLFSVGLIYRFGGRTAPARATVPEYVGATLAPEPVAVTPPPPPKKVTFSADSLFDFGKANISPAGAQTLDKFAADLRGTDFDVVTVTGHTDRIGSHAYNMTLSTHRAEAVKTHLVEIAGIPAAKISAKGVDGSDPVTKPGECKGQKATKALIACLQPDRRVEVEVSGIR